MFMRVSQMSVLHVAPLGSANLTIEFPPFYGALDAEYYPGVLAR